MAKAINHLSITELEKAGVSLSEASLKKHHFFTATVYLSSAGDVVLSVSFEEDRLSLPSHLLPQGISASDAAKRLAQKLCAVDQRAVIRENGADYYEIAFSEDEYEKVLLKEYLPFSQESINEIIREEVLNSGMPYERPYSILIGYKEIKFIWGMPGGINRETSYRFRFTQKIKEPLSLSAVGLAINAGLGYNYTISGNTLSDDKDEHCSILTIKDAKNIF